MRISTKLTIATALAALLLVGAVGLVRYREEEQERRAVLENETRLLGRSLQVAFENALRDRQLQDVHETLRELERIAPTVDILVFDVRGTLVMASKGAVETSYVRAMAHRPRRGPPIIRYVPAGDPRALLVSVPLRREEAGADAAIVVSRPLDRLRADLAAARRTTALSVFGFVVVVAALTFGLGRLYVGRPLGRMVAAMRRVRAGDLSSQVGSERSDEVGMTVREFDALVAELQAARERLQVEQESRARLEHGLQHVDKLVTIGQLSAGLAHEIGSPLQVLEGRARAMLRRPGDAERVQRNAGMLLEQAERITRIVSQLLAFARRRPAAPRRIDVLPPVRSVLDLLELEARHARVTLALEATEGLAPVTVDPDQLQQVVLNLVRNALQATAPGGRVTVRVAAGDLARPGHSRTVPACRLAVEDTGCGMPPESLARLFEPFFTTRADQGGTGLGLAVVKSIVDEHGGVVTARSAPGEGSELSVWFPLEGVIEADVDTEVAIAEGAA